MDLFSLTVIAAVVVFALSLANGRGIGKALGAGAMVLVAGFALSMVLMVLFGVAAGVSLFAALASILLAPIVLLLSPILLFIGLIWLIGYSRRDPV